VMTDPVYGTFSGEVVNIFDEGQSGTVVITDDRDNIVDTFTGKAADFQARGEWQSID
jgi:hypothetical protein